MVHLSKKDIPIPFFVYFKLQQDIACNSHLHFKTSQDLSLQSSLVSLLHSYATATLTSAKINRKKHPNIGIRFWHFIFFLTIYSLPKEYMTTKNMKPCKHCNSTLYYRVDGSLVEEAGWECGCGKSFIRDCQTFRSRFDILELPISLQDTFYK